MRYASEMQIWQPVCTCRKDMQWWMPSRAGADVAVRVRTFPTRPYNDGAPFPPCDWLRSCASLSHKPIHDKGADQKPRDSLETLANGGINYRGS